MMGFHEESRCMSVEFYQGQWILRAVMTTDIPAAGNPQAAAAMEHWRRLNRAKWRPG